MDKNDSGMSAENEIRFPRQALVVQAKAKAEAMKY